MNHIKGRAWRFGSNVDTDQIIPAEYLVMADPVELGKHAFEKVRPDFVKGVKKGDIIVADENFGCGSSREHAPRALMGCGISCVIAKSFARIYFRNSINLGFPAIECGVDASDGDEIEVDYSKGKVRNVTTGKEYGFKPLPEFLLNLMESGGLVEYVKKQLKK
ncbi:MAG: 3-isopropylmalate dehydratase small subunit [Candidatus Altiarchaeota archaeon]